MLPSLRVHKLAAPLAVAMMVTALSGCHWFGKNELYAENGQARPLEVPPDLDLPAADKAMVLPQTGSVSVSALNAGKSTARTATGFAVAAEREAVFAKVGEVLAATDGVKVLSKAGLLGSYDVDYQGATFLVRVTAADSGAFVSAVDARGLPPQGEAAGKLIAILKAAIAP